MDLSNLDPAFVSELKAQNKAAFNLLVQNGHYRLLAFASSMVGAQQAEDVMQDAWVAVWRGLPGFEGRSSLLTWLYTITRNECSARLKRHRKEPAANPGGLHGQSTEDWLQGRFSEDGSWSDPPSEWNLNTPDAALEGNELAACLEKHIESLQATQKAVFLLRDIEQLEFDAICNILGISHSNARVQLHRARLQLLKVIDHYLQTGNC